MSVNIVKVTRDEPFTYEAFQVEDNAESLHLALRWLSSRAESEESTFPNNWYEAARGLEGHWIVRPSDSSVAFTILETDFAADWTIVEDDPFDAIVEQEFSNPELSDEMKERGEFRTEEVWQCFEGWGGELTWWDATDEANARARSKAAGFPDKVRVQTITTVIGPWRTA